jgi:hypothetical protein
MLSSEWERCPNYPPPRGTVPTAFHVLLSCKGYIGKVSLSSYAADGVDTSLSFVQCQNAVIRDGLLSLLEALLRLLASHLPFFTGSQIFAFFHGISTT